MDERFISAGPAEGLPARADADRLHTGDPAGTEASAAGDDPITDPRALQILSTEHWSLLTARSLVYNETFARGGMFLALLSATLVALGLISTATGFSDAFLVAAAAVLGLDLFVGVASLGRIAAASREDLQLLQGMNRLRHAYFRIVPGLERYFITNGYDDFQSVAAMYGPADVHRLAGILHGFTTMPGMIAVICCGLGGMLVGVVTLLATHDPSLAGLLALAAGVVLFVVFTASLMRWASGFAGRMESLFPRPRDEPSRTP